MNTVERTVELFSSGLSCSQAMLVAFGEPFGLTFETAKNLGRPLSGGMGRMGRTCGAISAAALILGLANERRDEGEARNVTYPDVQSLLKQFESIHKSIECRILLGVDISTAEGLKKMQEEKLATQLCPVFVRDAARILEQLLNR